MSMNDNIQLDGSRVEVRGRRTAAAGGIGAMGIIGVIITYLLTGNIDIDQLTTSAQPQVASAEDQQGLVERCTTGSDANLSTDCWMVATAESLDAFWQNEMPKATNISYTMPKFVLFSGATSTACGMASAQTGPFYCPGDRAVYLDTAFFEQLRTQFGAQNTTLAQAYIVAHEFGHSIQHQAGILNRIDQRDTGPTGSLVRSELQADCLAGAWMKNASATVDPESGIPFLIPPTQKELESAVRAASAVGDDHIYEQAGQVARQENFTHGSSKQRTNWLLRGYKGGSFDVCDTWTAARP